MHPLATLFDVLPQLMILAQANDSSKWVAPIILVVVVVLVIMIGAASRKSAEEGGVTPEIEEPESGLDLEQYDNIPTTDLDKLRARGFDPAEIDKILAKAPEERTIAEVKKLNLAKQAAPDLADRVTAAEATERSKEEHQNLEDEAEQDAEELDEASDAEVEDEVGEAGAGEVEDEAEAAEEEEEVEQAAAEAAPEEDEGKSVVEGLQKTREGFGGKFFGMFKGKEEISDELRDSIEEFLYTADIGAKAATKIMDIIDEKLRDDVKRDPERVWEFVRGYITHEMLQRHEAPLDVDAHDPFVMLVVGVNGAGKTTTIGKLASRYKRQGKKVMVVAGDTFRAAAVEQLEVWAERVDVPLHKGEPEADPASVVFDGIKEGIEQGCDVIICDTSGRLHTNKNLMNELVKIQRVSGKALEGAPHETMLVLDANSGQNAVRQAETFSEALELTGITLTKLDGTARGGVILGIGEVNEVPVRYIGIGEGIKDLREFKAEEFAEALFL